MNSAQASPATRIPYEAQIDLQGGGRTCGAACLSMVYRSFGKKISQTEIWPAIAKRNRFGSVASTTHLIAKDAINRGFVSVAMVARHPLQALRICRDSGIRAVLNHRHTAEVGTGHYSVLVDIDDTDILLHDPYFGPARRLSHAQLLDLWQPRFQDSEILGNVLIGIAEQADQATTCWLCKGTIPPAIDCPRCKNRVGLQPNALISCVNPTCGGRMWEYVCCPACDYTWNFALQSGQGCASKAGLADFKGSRGEERDSWMKPLFAELDKFCNHIRELPGATDHPEIRKYLDLIESSKPRIVLANSESRVFASMVESQLKKMQEESQLKKEECRRKMEILETPPPPLDGNALRRALLENLGLIERLNNGKGPEG